MNLDSPFYEDPGQVVDHQRLRLVDDWTNWVASETTRRLSEVMRDEKSYSGQDYRRRAERVIAQVLDEAAGDALAEGRAVLDAATEADIARRVLAQVCGFGPLQVFLDDPEIENINCNGTRVWIRYADGRREQKTAIFGDSSELIALVRRIAAEATTGERRFDPGAPILDMQLPGGERMNAVMEVAREPSVSIRRHRYSTTTLEQLRDLGTLDNTLVALLRASVRSRRNMVVTGGTGAGKTTLLRAIAAEIPPEERLVTIEDVFELGLDRDEAHPDCVALQARPANVEGAGAVTIADLVRTALRMSPDRVIVGETRGHETVPLLNAMSQGNDGSLTTLHASDSSGAFTKFGAYAAQSAERLPLEATAALVASAVHLVVHVSSTPAGRRMVTSVREVVGAEEQRVVSNEIYRRRPNGEQLPAAPPGTDTVAALTEVGFDTSLLHADVSMGGGW
ncbi:CpaF family protein [Nocardiopsis ansamitocini]|uniref:Protein kinase n=1 Tax=Nocardiopsis ansamitocini TaxID=1670832 RepID=A0A9W6P5E9_9ACTN|nr:ATPase, T2SS/T4P/T4SS family [Nocardiopsis ansamitocini]GLU47471.1 protein kinase [Nocardiopsis ansamitocini]